MSRKYKFHDNYKAYFISFATVNWIDVFTRNEYKDAVLNCWKFSQEHKGLEIYAWCIMPSHVHMIIGSSGATIADLVGEMKSYTATQMKKMIKEHPQESRREWMVWMFERAGKRNSNNKDWQFWQQHNQPIEIISDAQYAAIVFYIHQNPVTSGFVYEAEQWIYSSAKHYEDNKGLIKLAAFR